MQLGHQNEYRARIYESGGHWWVSIESPNSVGGWMELSVGVGGGGWLGFQETWDMTRLRCSSESEARAKAEKMLAERRAEHARMYPPHRHEEIIT